MTVQLESHEAHCIGKLTTQDGSAALKKIGTI